MKKAIFGIVVLAAIAVGGWLFLRERSLVVTLDQGDLQGRLEEMFPVERSYLLLLSVSLTDPKVSLVEGSNRIDYEMTASVSLRPVGEKRSGSARISGLLRYDPKTRQLFLQDSRLEEFDIDEVPEKYRERVREVATLAVREHLSDHAVYTLKESQLDRLPAGVELRKMQVKNGKLRLFFGIALGK